MTPFEKGLFFIGWSVERLASNCVKPVEDILPIVQDERPMYDGSLPIRVLEQRGVRFLIQGGYIIDAVSPDNPDTLKTIVLTDNEIKSLRDLISGPIATEMTGIATSTWFGSLRKNSLIEIGTVQEVLEFNGERHPRPSNRQAIRLSKKGRIFLGMLERAKNGNE